MNPTLLLRNAAAVSALIPIIFSLVSARPITNDLALDAVPAPQDDINGIIEFSESNEGDDMLNDDFVVATAAADQDPSLDNINIDTNVNMHAVDDHAKIYHPDCPKKKHYRRGDDGQIDEMPAEELDTEFDDDEQDSLDQEDHNGKAKYEYGFKSQKEQCLEYNEKGYCIKKKHKKKNKGYGGLVSSTSSVYGVPTTTSQYYSSPSSSYYQSVTTTSISKYQPPTTSSSYYQSPTTSSSYYQSPTTSTSHYQPPTSNYQNPTTSTSYDQPTTTSSYDQQTTSKYVPPTEGYDSTTINDYDQPTTTKYGKKSKHHKNYQSIVTSTYVKPTPTSDFYKMPSAKIYPSVTLTAYDSPTSTDDYETATPITTGYDDGSEDNSVEEGVGPLAEDMVIADDHAAKDKYKKHYDGGKKKSVKKGDKKHYDDGKKHDKGYHGGMAKQDYGKKHYNGGKPRKAC
ncbi:hypothetical protein HDU76_000578 [Blyttiomyces sp. JEL0837]|nr:hypothetical protein HDU76_000578 [Blyttiomyces sp. JEL0837]